MKHVLVVGSSVVDLTFYTQRIPQIGETLTGQFKQGLGGKGFNQAVAARLSGAPTRFISALGRDSFAPAFKQRLAELKIESALEEVSDASTGAAAISVDAQGKNNIIVALGANEKLSSEFLDQNVDFFRNVGVLILQFETNLKVNEHALKLVKKHSPDGVTILNPAPALAKIPAEVLGLVDILTPNETELEIISGKSVSNANSENGTEIKMNEACMSLRGPKAVLTTLGEKGCFHFPTRKMYPAFKVNAFDTSGAGDAFNGGFAAALLEMPLENAIRFGSAVAALSVTKPGTSASLPSRAEVDIFLRQ